jgi:hypothetical protein
MVLSDTPTRLAISVFVAPIAASELFHLACDSLARYSALSVAIRLAIRLAESGRVSLLIAGKHGDGSFEVPAPRMTSLSEDAVLLRAATVLVEVVINAVEISIGEAPLSA